MSSARDVLVAVGYALSWAVTSSGLILLNKYILSTLDFHYPLTLSRCVWRLGARDWRHSLLCAAS